MNRRHGKLRACVERPRAFPGAAPAHQIPLTGQHDLDDKLPRLAFDCLLELHLLFRGLFAARFADQTTDGAGAFCPLFRPGTQCETRVVFRRLFVSVILTRFVSVFGLICVRLVAAVFFGVVFRSVVFAAGLFVTLAG